MKKTVGTDLVFVVRVVLPANEADMFRTMVDTDGSVYESTDEEITADALTYFLGWNYHAVIETIDCE